MLSRVLGPASAGPSGSGSGSATAGGSGSAMAGWLAELTITGTETAAGAKSVSSKMSQFRGDTKRFNSLPGALVRKTIVIGAPEDV